MTSFRTSVRPYIQISILARGPEFETSTRFCHFVFLKNEKKNKKMTDWLHSVRTDGLPHTLLHCIALHCIVLHCIAFTIRTCITHCIALHCITYWLNVMLIVRHVCSWIVPSVTFNSLPLNFTSDRICVLFVCVCPSRFLAPDLRWTDSYWLYATELKLNWNNWNLSVHPWHSYILTFYIDISILAEKMTSFNTSVRPYIQISIFERSWVRNLASTDFVIFLYF
jgi:hypothetical protein